MGLQNLLVRLSRAEDPDLLRLELALSAVGLAQAEGAYLLEEERGVYQVKTALGPGQAFRGLRFPKEVLPPEGPTPPPGPFGLSPDGKPRKGYVLFGGRSALVLEGVAGLTREAAEGLRFLLRAVEREAAAFRFKEALRTLEHVGRELADGRSPVEKVRAVLALLLEVTGARAGAVWRLEGEEIVPWVREGPSFPLSLPRPLPSSLYDKPELFPQDPPLLAVGLLQGREPFGGLALWGVLPQVLYPETLALVQLVREELEVWLRQYWYAEGLLESLSRIMEVLDYETEGHMRRVADLSVALGRLAGVEDLEGLRFGAYLHDLGKVFLPKEVLHKKGSLATAEWRLVKTHPEAGYEVLRAVPFLPKTALEVVLYHHERWDGTGYPKGLKGEEIPLPARVFAVVDVWDALLSKRSYKEPLEKEAARRVLLEEAGKGLDPLLVSLFLQRVVG